MVRLNGEILRKAGEFVKREVEAGERFVEKEAPIVAGAIKRGVIAGERFVEKEAPIVAGAIKRGAIAGEKALERGIRTDVAIAKRIGRGIEERLERPRESVGRKPSEPLEFLGGMGEAEMGAFDRKALKRASEQDKLSAELQRLELERAKLQKERDVLALQREKIQNVKALRKEVSGLRRQRQFAKLEPLEEAGETVVRFGKKATPIAIGIAKELGDILNIHYRKRDKTGRKKKGRILEEEERKKRKSVREELGFGREKKSLREELGYGKREKSRRLI